MDLYSVECYDCVLEEATPNGYDSVSYIRSQLKDFVSDVVNNKSKRLEITGNYDVSIALFWLYSS